MRPSFPQVVIARDGECAISIVDIAKRSSGRSNFDGFHLDGSARLGPRGQLEPVDFRVSGSFRTMWDIPNQTLRWDEKFDAAVPELALIAAGQFLDASGQLESVGPSPLVINVFSDLFDIFKLTPASDGELLQYVRAKIYWNWRFQNEPKAFQRWEAQRLAVDVTDLDQAAFAGVGALWDRDSGGYRARPALIEEMESRREPPARVPSSGQYDVALSFAGEQRTYVNAVATALTTAGAKVFYDEFEDLWGKDLTKELEQVYRRGSRYVVVFVSREYVEKAWPNLERQHALAGRIERMDDSVLPARFDSTELPGMPATVSYLDIGTQSPEQLAQRILRRLRG